jgi:hypothetical protein
MGAMFARDNRKPDLNTTVVTEGRAVVMRIGNRGGYCHESLPKILSSEDWPVP